MSKQLVSSIPLLLTLGIGMLVGFAGLQACGDKASMTVSADLSNSGDLSSSDLSKTPDLAEGTLMQKHEAACQKVCSCFITSLDLTTCTNDCLADAGGSFNTYFGATMVAGCYDCVSASTCSALMSGSSCFGSSACP